MRTGCDFIVLGIFIVEGDSDGVETFQEYGVSRINLAALQGGDQIVMLICGSQCVHTVVDAATRG
jgi:hypothetical protein